MSGIGTADPFDVLGLGPDCSDDEVKAAFRRAAAACHPDSQAGRSDPGAAERFRACVAARDALLDKDRRAEAARRRAAPPRGGDAFGSSFDAFFDNIDRHGRGAAARTGPRPRRGADIERTVALSLEQAFRGGAFLLRDAPGPCRPCEGSGQVRSERARECEGCGGSGRVSRTKGLITLAVECPGCAGTGRTHRAPCPDCAGQGRNEGAGTPYQVPPGARDGLVSVLRGYGAPGFAGGARGDLRLLFRVRRHVVFEREGDDLRAGLTVPVWDVALGCRREIAGIDGEPVEVVIEPGLPGGRVLTFPGRGMPAFPGRGDLRVEVAIEVPPAASPALREAYEGLRAAAISER